MHPIMVPFVDLGRAHAALSAELEETFRRVLRDGRFIMGPDVGDLERELAGRLGVAHAIGVSSGTDALLVSLMALGIGPGHEVLVPTLTFFATAGAVVRLGATPVFVDVDPGTLLMDTGAALSLRSPRTRAALPVHLFGQCVDVEPLRAAGIDVIEDAAQAFGAADGRDRPAGAQGTAGCFSFFPTKTLGGFGDGGLVTTDDDALADRLRMLRVHGARPKFHHLAVGGNFRLDTLQAALLRVKLPHLEAWTEARRTLAARYRERLGPLVAAGHLQLVAESPGRHVYHQFVVRVADRDRVRAELRALKIGTGIYYPEPLHVQPCFNKEARAALPHAERACGEVLALPCFAGLTEAEQDEVIDGITRVIAAVGGASG